MKGRTLPQDRPHNITPDQHGGDVFKPCRTGIEAARWAARALLAEAGAMMGRQSDEPLGKQYAMLADLIAILDFPDPDERQLVDAEQAMSRLAGKYVQKAFDMGDDVDLLTRSVAQAIQAHLAYRARDFSASRECASRASEGYVQMGALAGLEGIERLLGLLELRSPTDDSTGTLSDETRRAALRHFRVSHLLAEFTSCSIDPGLSSGRGAIVGTGLKNLEADYHANNYYPQPDNLAEMRYGSFVQLWATRYGEGRVVAFTDSTIFSNFSTLNPASQCLGAFVLENDAIAVNRKEPQRTQRHNGHKAISDRIPAEEGSGFRHLALTRVVSFVPLC